jgi:hypothetical protein
LASAGVIANATMAMALTRIGSLVFFAFRIMNLLASVRVNFNPESLSKACAVVWCEIDQESSWVRSAGEKRFFTCPKNRKKRHKPVQI